MKIERIAIENFRSIGSTIELNFGESGSITLVGENNVGKSAILSSLSKCWVFPRPQEHPGSGLLLEDWHNQDEAQVFSVEIHFSLSDWDVQGILSKMGFPNETQNDVIQRFGRKIRYIFRYSRATQEMWFQWGDMTVQSRQVSIRDDRRNVGSYLPVSFDSLVRSYRALKGHRQKPPSIIDLIDRAFDEQSKKVSRKKNSRESEQQVVLEFEVDVRILLQEQLRMSFIFFSEFRQLPDREVLEEEPTISGRRLAQFLKDMKMGKRDARQRFAHIRSAFTRMFPGLELDVIQEEEQTPRVSVCRGDIESTTGFFGAGIFEMILLLSHIIGEKEKMIVLDEPEIHLHPHAQKLLSSYIEKSDNQFLLATHSPFFLKSTRLQDIVRVKLQKGETTLDAPRRDYWQPKTVNSLQQWMDATRLELFFSRKVLLVDGPTEVGAYPVFGQLKGYDFNQEGVSVISLDGKGKGKLFVPLLEEYKIPYVIVLDDDKKDPKNKEHKEVIQALVNKPNQVILLPSNFEGTVKKEHARFLRAGKRLFRQSKPKIGRYVAEKMVEEKTIPKDFVKVIKKLKTLPSSR